MIKVLVNNFLKPYEKLALEKYANGAEAIERCRASLIAGRGLCKGEFRFLQRLYMEGKLLYNPIERIDDFIAESGNSIARISSYEEKEFWKSILPSLQV